MRFLGSILILLASIGYAWQLGMDLRNHLKLLYEIRKLLSKIEAEIHYSGEPMEEILKEAARESPKKLVAVCEQIRNLLAKKAKGSGGELWKQGIREMAGELGLTGEEQEILEEAGNAFFGKSMEENEKNFAHYMERLDDVTDRVRTERKEKQKVYQTVSVVCGLMVILLFL